MTAGFTTGFAADATPPAIIGTNPENGDNGITVNTQVMLQFSETINEITALQGVVVSYNGVPIPGSFSFQNNDTIILFTPSNPYLPGLTTVTTTQGVTDVAGNVISNVVTYSFTVDSPADTAQPSVTYGNPPLNATGVGRNVTVQALFDKRVNPLTVNSSSFVLQDNNTYLVIPGTATASANRLGATFTPSNPLAANTTYCWNLIQ